MTPLQMSYRIWPVVLLLQNLFILGAGFTLLVLSGDKLVETSIRIARYWKVPTSVVAVTIIAAGTSAPELVTSFLAGYKGSSDISVGNVIGSNTFNILAVGGLSMIFNPRGLLSGTFVSWIVLAVATSLFYMSLTDLKIESAEATILMITLVAFIVLSFFRDRQPEETFENLDNNGHLRTFIFFIFSFLGLIFGAELALKGGVALGQMAGLSERVIAITIISVGTGLPELATSIAAAFRGHSEIALANVIGSNIFNTLAIPGVTASFYMLQVDSSFIEFDFYVMAAATVSILLIYASKNPSLRRATGVLMFVGYSAYALKLIFSL
jgi:cation:H+ antiporter